VAVLKIEGDASGAIRAIQQIESALGGIQRSVSQAQRSLSGLQQSLVGIAGVLAGGSLMTFVDDLQNMQNKLRIATNSQEEFNKSLEYVRAIADKTGQSLAATGDLYASVARNAEKLGYDQNQVVTVTNAMATALKASGASAQGAASVMYQFSQILAKGKVNGDEFTTIMENLGGPVMDLVAKNMGLTTAQLIEYKEKGLIGARDFTDALIRSMSELDGMAGKSSQTIGQSMQRIQNAFASVILSLDNSTGFSTAFADAAAKISANGENLIPVIKAIGLALAGLAVYFAPVVTLFTAAAAAALYFADVLGPILKPVIDAIESALGAVVKRLVGFGSAIAALSRGENPFEAYKKSLEEWDQRGKDVNKTQTQTNKLLEDAKKSAQGAISAQPGQLEGVGQKFALILKDIQEQAKLTAQTNREYDIQSQILQTNKQLNYQLTDAQKRQLAALYQQIQAQKDLLATNELIRKLQSDTSVAAIQDAGQRQVATQLENYRLSVSKEVYNQKRAEVQLAIEQNIQTKALTEYQDNIRKAQGEITRLGIKDLDLREQQAAVDAERLKLGSLFTKEMEDQVRAVTQMTQRTRELAAEEKLRNLLVGQANPMNRAQQIETATGVVSRLDPRLAQEQQFQTEMQAIRDSEVIAEDQKNVLLERLRREHADRMHSIAKSQAEADLRFAGVTNQGIIDATMKSMDNIRMIQEGGVKAVMGGVDQLSYIFGQLGTYNKKAFEAAKAFNIANAVMNTYLGATKALAMYPPPFNFIAAAAVVASGLAQVAAIRSQSFSGRALGGPVMGGQSYIVGENGPELFTPSQTGSITRNDQLGGGAPVNVNFTIVANDTQGFDQLLSSRKGVITQIISDAMLERGQRSMV